MRDPLDLYLVELFDLLLLVIVALFITSLVIMIGSVIYSVFHYIDLEYIVGVILAIYIFIIFIICILTL